ncbi:MAG: hypothetical protein S4CHLAM20_10080 [Chlamydiia bacterium]|nr:hypothetical protein [Chlamydiia bacterium]
MGQVKKQISRVLTYPSGMNHSGFYRTLWPAYYLEALEHIEYNISMQILRDESIYSKVDVVQIQKMKEMSPNFLEKLISLRKKFGFRLICDVDEFIDDKIIELCDEVVVSTPFLKEQYLLKFSQNNFSVITSKIPHFWAGSFYHEESILNNYRENKSKPRVLICSGTSRDDFSHVINEIKQTINDFKWIFFETIPWELQEEVKDGLVEFYPEVTMDSIHKQISSLKCHLIVAPLQDTLSNHAKGDEKMQEAAAHGLPIIAQDITPYKKTALRFKSGKQMIDLIYKTLENEDRYMEASRQSRKMVDKNWLELDENIGMYKELFAYSYNDLKRWQRKEFCY